MYGLTDTGFAVSLENDHIVEAPGVDLSVIALDVKLEGEGTDDIVDKSGVDGDPDGVDVGAGHGRQLEEVASGGVRMIGGVCSCEVGEACELFGVKNIIV